MTGDGLGYLSRLLFIVCSFPPLQHSGTLRSEAFARFLPDYGIETAIFAATPESLRSHRIVSGSTLLQDWNDDSRWLGVTRVPWPTLHITGGARWGRRIPLMATIVRRSERRQVVDQLFAAASEAVEMYRPDVLLASAQPAETVCLAVKLRKRFGLPVVADLRDPWSYVGSAPYRHYIDFVFERAAERKTLEQCDHIVVTCAASKELLAHKVGINSSKISVIPNGYISTDRCASHKRVLLDPEKINLVHLGELSSVEQHRFSLKGQIKNFLGIDYVPLKVDATARSPRWVLEAAARVLKERPDLRTMVRFWFVGVGEANQYESFRSFPFPDCLSVLQRVPANEADGMARAADILLLLQNQYFLDGKDCCVAIAAKTYTYLKAGRPILACVQPSEMGQLVENSGRGHVVPPTNVDAIEKSLIQMIEEARVRPRKAITADSLGQFDRRLLARKLGGILNRVAMGATGDAESMGTAFPANTSAVSR